MITAMKINQIKKFYNAEGKKNIILINEKLKLLDDLCDEYIESRKYANGNNDLLSPEEKLIHPELFFTSHEFQKLNILNLIYRGKYKYSQHFYKSEKVRNIIIKYSFCN